MTAEALLPDILRLFAPDGVIAYPVTAPGKTTTIAGANEAICTLLGYSPQELLALTPADVIANFTTLTGDGCGPFDTGNRRIEHELTHQSGDTVPVELKAHVIRVDGRDMVVMAARDIRDRIAEHQRMEQDILLAAKSSEQANRSKNQFLANMSHELRTPLNGIMGMTQLLLGTDVTNEQKEYLTLSMEASLHLSKVMTSLLDLSSIEADAVTVVPVNFSLPDTLDALVRPLALQAGDNFLNLRYEFAPDVPTQINGDEKKLRQILINLIHNAIKFTEQGEVGLSVKRTASSSGLFGDMTELRFTVTDTGVGIPEDRLEAIFEPFVLGEDYMTKQYGGSGLGLSISRELAKAMGGSITVRSNPGQGSAFTLTLPFGLREARGGSCSIPDRGERPDRPLKILAAEDERVNALVTSGILRKQGHEVTVVDNGQHVIDALMHHPFDLVLMDVQMPIINGLEVTEIIRRGAAENVPRDIPIIGLTAYASDEDLRLCLEAGMDSVVTKPFEAENLLAAICRAMTD